jgi:hypothetical protein
LAANLLFWAGATTDSQRRDLSALTLFCGCDKRRHTQASNARAASRQKGRRKYAAAPRNQEYLDAFCIESQLRFKEMASNRFFETTLSQAPSGAWLGKPGLPMPTRPSAHAHDWRVLGHAWRGVRRKDSSRRAALR